MTNKKKILDELNAADRDELAPVLEKLAAWEAPVPTRQETRQLLSILENGGGRVETAAISRSSVMANALQMLRGQMYVVRQELFAASTLVIALGTILSILVPVGDLAAPNGLALALAAPLIAALGMCFLYGTGAEQVVEMEMSTPISQRKILLARMTLIFGFNLVLALAGSLLLAAAGAMGWIAPLNFFGLVEIWLAPMAALSALAFVITVISGDPLVGSSISLLIWGVQALKLFGQQADLSVWVPDFFSSGFRPVLWLLAITLGAIGFWIAGKETTHLRRHP